MMRKAVWLSLLCSLTSVGPSVASANAEAMSLAVMPVDSKGGLDSEIAAMLTEILTSTIADMGRFDVISTRDIADMLQFDQLKMMAGCEDVSCSVEIGGALGVDGIIVTQVGVIGATYVVNMKWISVSTTEVKGRLSKTIQGKEDILITTLKQAVHELMGTTLRADVSSVTESSGAPTMTIPFSMWGGAAVAAGIGAYFGNQAVNAKSDLDETGAQKSAAQTIEDGESAQGMANLFFGVSAAAAITGLGWWLLMGNDKSEASGSSSAAVITPDYVGVSVWFDL